LIELLAGGYTVLIELFAGGWIWLIELFTGGCTGRVVGAAVVGVAVLC